MNSSNWGISVLEYSSKFMELSHFASTFIADEKLKINHFEGGLNPNIKQEDVRASIYFL